MTMQYAYIHDATLRRNRKIPWYQYINEVIESLHREIDNDADLQWMKKKVN